MNTHRCIHVNSGHPASDSHWRTWISFQMDELLMIQRLLPLKVSRESEQGSVTKTDRAVRNGVTDQQYYLFRQGKIK